MVQSAPAYNRHRGARPQALPARRSEQRDRQSSYRHPRIPPSPGLAADQFSPDGSAAAVPRVLYSQANLAPLRRTRGSGCKSHTVPPLISGSSMTIRRVRKPCRFGVVLFTRPPWRTPEADEAARGYAAPEAPSTLPARAPTNRIPPHRISHVLPGIVAAFVFSAFIASAIAGPQAPPVSPAACSTSMAAPSKAPR